MYAQVVIFRVIHFLTLESPKHQRNFKNRSHYSNTDVISAEQGDNFLEAAGVIRTVSEQSKSTLLLHHPGKSFILGYV